MAVDGDLGWAIHCEWGILVKRDLCLLQADGQTECLSSPCEVVNHCLKSVLCVCSSRISSSVVSFSGEEATEIKDTSISSKPDVDAFAQFFLNLSQHRARDLLPVLAVPPFLVRALELFLELNFSRQQPVGFKHLYPSFPHCRPVVCVAVSTGHDSGV